MTNANYGPSLKKIYILVIFLPIRAYSLAKLNWKLETTKTSYCVPSTLRLAALR